MPRTLRFLSARRGGVQSLTFDVAELNLIFLFHIMPPLSGIGERNGLSHFGYCWDLRLIETLTESHVSYSQRLCGTTPPVSASTDILKTQPASLKALLQESSIIKALLNKCFWQWDFVERILFVSLSLCVCFKTGFLCSLKVSFLVVCCRQG